MCRFQTEGSPSRNVMLRVLPHLVLCRSQTEHNLPRDAVFGMVPDPALYRPQTEGVLSGDVVLGVLSDLVLENTAVSRLKVAQLADPNGGADGTAEQRLRTVCERLTQQPLVQVSEAGTA